MDTAPLGSLLHRHWLPGRYTGLPTFLCTHDGLLMTTPPIPDPLDGEPDFRPGSLPRVVLLILQLSIMVVVLVPVCVLCGLFYFPLRLLYHAGPDEDGSPKVLLVKGHFLASADAL